MRPPPADAGGVCPEREIGRPPQSQHRHAGRAAPAGPRRGLLQLDGDRFVLAADQGSSMPDTAVGLAGQHLRERFVGAPATFDWRCLADR